MHWFAARTGTMLYFDRDALQKHQVTIEDARRVLTTQVHNVPGILRSVAGEGDSRLEGTILAKQPLLWPEWRYLLPDKEMDLLRQQAAGHHSQRSLAL